jgi:hypothetical protein
MPCHWPARTSCSLKRPDVCSVFAVCSCYKGIEAFRVPVPVKRIPILTVRVEVLVSAAAGSKRSLLQDVHSMEGLGHTVATGRRALPLSDVLCKLVRDD